MTDSSPQSIQIPPAHRARLLSAVKLILEVPSLLSDAKEHECTCSSANEAQFVVKIFDDDAVQEFINVETRGRSKTEQASKQSKHLVRFFGENIDESADYTSAVAHQPPTVSVSKLHRVFGEPVPIRYRSHSTPEYMATSGTSDADEGVRPTQDPERLRSQSILKRKDKLRKFFGDFAAVPLSDNVATNTGDANTNAGIRPVSHSAPEPQTHNDVDANEFEMEHVMQAVAEQPAHVTSRRLRKMTGSRIQIPRRRVSEPASISTISTGHADENANIQDFKQRHRLNRFFGQRDVSKSPPIVIASGESGMEAATQPSNVRVSKIHQITGHRIDFDSGDGDDDGDGDGNDTSHSAVTLDTILDSLPPDCIICTCKL